MVRFRSTAMVGFRGVLQWLDFGGYCNGWSLGGTAMVGFRGTVLVEVLGIGGIEWMCWFVIM